MGHAGDVLRDDRPLVEVGGGVVGGRADHLHPPLVGLVVGLGADERRQQRVVDVDDLVRVARHELLAEHLHVAGQHQQLDARLVGERDDLRLLGGLVTGHDRQVVERHPEERAGLGVVGVVAHDEGDVGVQLAGAPAGQQVEQAVRLAGGQHADACDVLGQPQLALHPEAVADLAEGRQHLGGFEREAVELELHPLEEQPVVVVGVLVDLDDVRAVPGEEFGDGGDDAAGVFAGQQQHGGAAAGRDVPRDERRRQWVADGHLSALPESCARRDRLRPYVDPAREWT